MALHDTDKIDLVSRDNNNEDFIYLTIFDALGWEEEVREEHALLLQEKINAYLAFIENGEINTYIPELTNTSKFIIRVIAKYDLNDYAGNFYSLVRDVLHNAGYGLQFDYKHSKNEEKGKEHIGINLKEIDSIEVDKDNDIAYLIINDEEDWIDEEKHIDLIHEKINLYLDFISGGEVYEKYPEIKEYNFVIKIYAKYLCTEWGKEFLEEVDEVLTKSGFGFQYVYQPSEEVEEVE
ncbi:DUF6572 domain-containing protein [Bacillus cereus group sp. BfR-BA-01489]|uniref:DUF6572 domain-containing protein n=1 Tax=Bacillus cereus group TaxID=86661 RepID=UPI001F5AB86C